MPGPALARLFTCALLCASLPAAGNVKQHITFAGEVVAYDYDTLNRLVTKTLPGANTVTYTYTATGRSRR